ncbi:GntR family transcriptional regulator [Streptomyces sp. AM8-1-1]|uniref:GntR family transcriptional regulator n=1 Tax=Streptomyces sp. AM8-1-1 TaxID=3075825 RepID=UPI0028C4E4AC|nr:GntR family transcriptional regulator [Streptomyces sp. AM8-1-1]WNO73081.1 GntR family transcriptional regulator [Streptomyces sp. AM8-1-1]
MSPAPEKKHDRRPPYQHAADELRGDILKGQLKPGEQMPSIRELQDRFGVANMTARSALNVLRDEGLIYTIHGRGSFVADSTDRTGESTPGYTPPAWYLAKDPKAARNEEPEEGTATSVTELLTALRDEIRALSADHQDLRREVEALKAQRQNPQS